MSDIFEDNKRTIFVFGSNRQGRHGKGAALDAKNEYGAVYGQPKELQGNSYAIVTKELRYDHPPVTLEEIKDQVDEFLHFAKSHPGWSFLVSAIGCGLAGFTPSQIAPMFINKSDNVVLPVEFNVILGAE